MGLHGENGGHHLVGLPIGDTGDPSMNSYNHYAFGPVVMARPIAARQETIPTQPAPGYHHLKGILTSIMRSPQLLTEYDSASYGTIISDCKQSAHRFTITIPANTTATVIKPNNKTETIGSGITPTPLIDGSPGFVNVRRIAVRNRKCCAFDLFQQNPLTPAVASVIIRWL